MRAVNLLPRDEKRTRLPERRVPLLVAGAGFVVVTLAAFALGHFASSTESDERSELESVQALIDRLPRPKAPTVSTSSIAQERTQRAAALTAALRSRVPLDKVFRQVALVLPEDAWLTGFKAAAPTTGASGAAGAAPPASAPPSGSSGDQGVTIEGATYSQEAVARVLARLALIPALDDVQLTSSAVVEPSTTERKHGKKVVTFTVSASVRGGAAS